MLGELLSSRQALRKWCHYYAWNIHSLFFVWWALPWGYICISQHSLQTPWSEQTYSASFFMISIPAPGPAMSPFRTWWPSSLACPTLATTETVCSKIYHPFPRKVNLTCCGRWTIQGLTQNDFFNEFFLTFPPFFPWVLVNHPSQSISFALLS